MQWDEAPECAFVPTRTGRSLAPPCSLAEAFPGMLKAVEDAAVARLGRGDRAERVVTSAVILAGMHLTDEQIEDAARRLPGMLDSVTFRVFEKMGAERQAKKTILRLGEARFGPPTDAQKQKLDVIEDLDRLNRLTDRLLKVKSWDALLRGR